MEDNPPSKMVRIPTPLVPVVQNLNKLYRQGHGLTLVHGLEEWISAIEKGGNVTHQVLTLDDNDLLSDVVARLERLESQQLRQGVSTVGASDSNFNEALTTLTLRVESLENALDELSNALVGSPLKEAQPQDVEDEDENDSEPIETVTPTLPPDLKPPLSQRELSERLGQRYPYYLQKHRAKGKAHFETWSQNLDPDGVAWTFDEPKQHRGKTSTKTLKFFPKR